MKSGRIDRFEAFRALRLLDVSLTLGYKKDLYEPIDLGSAIKVGPYIIDKDILLEISEKNYIYLLPEVRPIAIFDERLYKLYPVGLRKAPTLEISGVFMHRFEDPRRDAYEKVRLLKIKRGERVLDICTGLGYTSIHALRRGAKVKTIEISRAVIEIASKNPRSEDLKKAELINADAFEYVQELEERFDKILHDPPRISLAGELYSKDFYRNLYKLLKPNGILYHYVGDPGGKYRRKKLRRGVAKRLSEVGFKIIGFDEKTRGVIAKRSRDRA